VADERILAGVRRFWTREAVDAAYQKVLSAYANTVAKEVVIIGSDFDGQNSSAQYVLDREAMAKWLDVLEARLQEIEEAASGEAATVSGSPSTDFYTRRRVGT
jgi:hypothetical protein